MSPVYLHYSLLLYLDLSSSSFILSLAPLIYYLICPFQITNPLINEFLEGLLGSFSNLLGLFHGPLFLVQEKLHSYLKKKINSFFSLMSIKILSIHFCTLCLIILISEDFEGHT